jgi:uncharacterized membrane protein
MSEPTDGVQPSKKQWVCQSPNYMFSIIFQINFSSGCEEMSFRYLHLNDQICARKAFFWWFDAWPVLAQLYAGK